MATSFFGGGFFTDGFFHEEDTNAFIYSNKFFVRVAQRLRYWVVPNRPRYWVVKLGSNMPDTREKTASESRRMDFDCSLDLLPQERVTGTPTITITPTTSPALTAGAPVINTAAVSYSDGHGARPGKVIQSQIAGGLAGSTYTLKIRYYTTLSPDYLEAEATLSVT